MAEPCPRYPYGDGLDTLIRLLTENGYTVIGPTLRNGAVVLEPLASAAELPVGIAEETEKATYRLRERGEASLFGYGVGAFPWKRFLFPPERRLFTAERDGHGGFALTAESASVPPMALLGVRACDVAAIAIQDRVFMEGPYPDPVYSERRRNALIIGVNCTGCSATCFCTSMDTGPRLRAGYDLALTEILETTRHAFLVEAGSEAGERLLHRLPVSPASEAEIRTAKLLVDQAVAGQKRRLDQTNIHDLLLDNLDHPRWEDVAGRCLTCTNCTLQCPTCFCHTVEDATDLTGNRAERRQKWDSCFVTDFSYIVGGSVRLSGRSRYRQWLVHKLATWYDQFGSSGCVGCGRCITWCPAGIDLTEEVAAIRTAPKRLSAQPKVREHENTHPG